MLTLILGGARSGKSRLAQRLATTAGRVTYIATAQAGQDAEMAARIARHRADRPSLWRTIEEPLALAGAVERAANQSDAILVDCLTIWLSNLFWETSGTDAATHWKTPRAPSWSESPPSAAAATSFWSPMNWAAEQSRRPP